MRLALAALLLVPSLAWAQAPDPKVLDLESQYLAQQAAEALRSAARAAALLTLERQAHEATKKELADLKAKAPAEK